MPKVNNNINTYFHKLPYIVYRSGKEEERYLWILNCLIDEVKEVRYKNQFTEWEKRFIRDCIDYALSNNLKYNHKVKLEEIYNKRQQL